MKLFFLNLLILVFFITCKKETPIKISFVDEYVLKDSINFKNTIIGGLSGIDYCTGKYYLVVDDDDLPRVLTAHININKDTISSIDFIDVIHLKDSISFFKNNALDLESVFVDVDNNLNITSEGSIKNKKNPSVFSIDKKGNFVGSYALPEYFNADSSSKPRHNALFEASCESFDKQGFWIGMEGVLEADGEAPSQVKKYPPARITYYSRDKKEMAMQFAYPLDYITRPEKGGLNVNGVTAMLEYAKDEFFIVERSFQSGYAEKGNIVKIYRVVLNETITNTYSLQSLKKESYTPVKKELVFDFDTITDRLTEGIIDNIEGITLGPKLSNGNSSLILISDDNFQKHSKQLNQFILLEISQ